MIFRQLFDRVSCTYTYVIASRHGGEALIIDPVFERIDDYLQLLKALDLKLVTAVDTHLHADHVTALGTLHNLTRCTTVMGAETRAGFVVQRVADGQTIYIDGLGLQAIHTPGHTSDSYCFAMDDRVFTGDTLLIHGCGRTDFDGGDPRALYDSLFGKLLHLPDDTLVYPGHDYKGRRVSTIAEEAACNPRLQAGSADQFASIMNGLDLPPPQRMDVAIPANLRLGLGRAAGDDCKWACALA